MKVLAKQLAKDKNYLEEIKDFEALSEDINEKR